MHKLLETGKTSLLKGFVSNRTKKKFSAYLVREASGKVGFEFEQRAAKPARAKTEAKVGAGGTAPKKACRGENRHEKEILIAATALKTVRHSPRSGRDSGNSIFPDPRG